MLLLLVVSLMSTLPEYILTDAVTATTAAAFFRFYCRFLPFLLPPSFPFLLLMYAAIALRFFTLPFFSSETTFCCRYAATVLQSVMTLSRKIPAKGIVSVAAIDQ